MKQKCSNGGSVPSTHTHRLTIHRSSYLFIMMLFALMLKVDVGWGQGCNELLANPELTLNSGVDDGEEAYCDGDVDHWIGVDHTAHILQKDQNATVACHFKITDRNNTITCLRADGTGVFRESMAQVGLNITNDALVTYNLAITTQLLNCGSSSNFPSANLDVYLNNEENFPGYCWQQNVGYTTIGAEFVGLTTINSFSLQTINFTFSPVNSFDALWIRSWRPINGNDLPYSVLGIEDVSLTCTTLALTDILVNNISGLSYNFSAENSSSVSTFDEYAWSVTNTVTGQVVTTSTAQSLPYTFTTPGTYSVCLDIVDNNGCCSTLCEDVVIDCALPSANFTLQGTCPNFLFVPTILDESFSYHWSINGASVGTNGVQSYTFTENGTYIIQLEVINECGQATKYSYTITIDCICHPPMANFNFAINCVNRQGVTTFNVLNGQIGDTYVWSFGDGTTATSTSTSIVHYYTTNQTFTVNLTVTNACGNTQIITKSVVVSCEQFCPQNDGRTQYTINGANGGITFSQALTILGIPYNPGAVNPFINLNFTLVGDVTLDLSSYFDNCKFIAMTGAQLILDPSATGQFNKGSAQFIGCQFFGCTNMWKGIRVDGVSASFYGGKIQDALYGIHSANLGDIVVSGVDFSHNFIGVYMTSNPSHSFAGNKFAGGTLKPKYNGYPNFANKNFAGIYAQGVTISEDGNPNWGCAFLTVGDNGGAPNTFNNLQNGIIHNGGFATRVKNNIFSNLQGGSTLNTVTNVSLNSNVQGVGLLINGGGLFGIEIEKNVMTNGENGVAIINPVFAYPKIKNYNQFTNFKNGLFCTGIGGLGGKIDVTDHNTFNCRVNGIFFDQNYGPSFEVKNNKFFQSSSVVVGAGSNGLKVNSLSGGTLGNWGQGLISGNEFHISTPKHSNGMIYISQYGSVSIINQNKYNFLAHSDLGNAGHSGIYLTNVSFAELTTNESYNYTTTTYSGINNLFNVGKSAICCNLTSGLNKGFTFGGTGTGRSTYSQNMMSGDFQGLSIGQGVKLGDQDNLGNTWLGASRVANLEFGASGANNRFIANENQNRINPPNHPTHPNQIVDFWPTQTPSDWFRPSLDIASENCDLNQCNMPLANISGDTPPTAEAIQVLEDMLDDGHIMIADYVAPGRWAKERWLYGFLTAHPYLMDYSEVLASFYTDVAEDVKQYEDFYQEIADRIALSPTDVESLHAQKEQAQSLIALHDTKWAAYQASNSQALYEELEAIRMQQGNLIPNAYQLMESHRNGMQEYWEEMKAIAEYLPEEQPYTQIAKQYANIYIDQLLHGDDYISTHHTATLQYIAGLCESMYKETVVLARNMLAHLGDNTQYDDQDICAESLENRTKAAPSAITITPNPTTGKVTVGNAGDIQAIEIRSAGGTLLRSVAGNQHSIDVTDLANGIYFITILQDNGEQVTKKLIKIN